TNVQGTYLADSTTLNGSAGPIRAIELDDASGPIPNSVALSSSEQVSVQIAVAGSFVNAQPGDPPIPLRLEKDGSQSQALDCNPYQFNFTGELQYGCVADPQPVDYSLNPGYSCSQYSPNNGSGLIASGNPPAWTCVATQ